MKKTTVLILCLGIFSLACLSTAAAESVAVVEMNTLAPVGDTDPELARDVSPTRAPTLVTSQRCAVVIAATALNLRAGAGVNDDVLTWILKGDVVALLDDTDPDWWRVQRGTVAGWARAKYLQESDCGVGYGW